MSSIVRTDQANDTSSVLAEYWSYVVSMFVSLLAQLFFVDVQETKSGEKEIEQPILEKPQDGHEPALPRDLKHVPFKFQRRSFEDSLTASEEFYDLLSKRRTIRFFSADPVPPIIIKNIIKCAGTGPSGVHTEPWTFVVVSNPEMKKTLRDMIEKEEQINYARRMGTEWVTDLKPLRTTWVKEHLTTAPYSILIFKQIYGFKDNGRKKTHYYHEISVAIATGILLAAVQVAGLVSLTTTPLNCGPAIKTLLRRPKNEKLLAIVSVGYPAVDATVPDLTRKSIEDIMVEI